MSIIKVIGVAILGMVCVGILKDVKPTLAAFAGIVSGIVILISIVDELQYVVNQFVEIAKIANVQDGMLIAILKIIGIGYCCEFTANLTDDYGAPSIGKKVLLAGKILILVLALPIVSGIITSIAEIIK